MICLLSSAPRLRLALAPHSPYSSFYRQAIGHARTRACAALQERDPDQGYARNDVEQDESTGAAVTYPRRLPVRCSVAAQVRVAHPAARWDAATVDDLLV
jgi:hypothetical protein